DSGEKCDNPQVLRLLRCMEQLHPNYRTVLNLYYIEGYDYEELGSILNITYGNCRTLLSRAKESLRSKMETQ
ncbi:MAG: RNA polymerase sigma factor, partial [Marinirhabdus sp.]